MLFQDEGRFGRIGDARSCWAPLPLRPAVCSQLIREYVYAYVAVCPADGQMSSMILPWVDARLMSIFLAQTAAQFPNEHCIMFLDGAGWHKAHELIVPANMRLLPLPPLLAGVEPRRTRLGVHSPKRYTQSNLQYPGRGNGRCRDKPAPFAPSARGASLHDRLPVDFRSGRLITLRLTAKWY